MRGRRAGFTLAEMAIVLVIVGLLLTSVLSTVSTQLEARNIAETQTRLNLIKDALTGFAQANGRLPCAADGTLATGAVGAGLEAVNGNVCWTPGTKYAVLPWATLGVPETDVWGRRFSYEVDVNFADNYTQSHANPNPSWGCGATPPSPEPASPTSFGLCALGSLTVKTRTAANKAGTSVSNVPVIIVSHGKNGYGAYTPGGTLVTAPPAVNADETANTPAAGSSTFYSREQSPQTSPCSDTAAGNFCEFDDIVAYIPVSVLVTRMVIAGKLP
jgi:prepilin-type N-terminal cleavage/methylation domain-containing protein